MFDPPAAPAQKIASEQQAMTRMLQAGHLHSVCSTPPPVSHRVTMMGMAKHLKGDLLSSGRKNDKQTGEMSDSKALKEALKLAKHKGQSP